MHSLAAMLQDLGQCEINELHVEAGAKLAGALLHAGLLDELLLYQATNFLGACARPLIAGAMLPVASWKVIDERRVGPDRRLQLRPNR